MVFLKIKCNREECYSHKFFFVFVLFVCFFNGILTFSVAFVSSDIAVVLLLDFSSTFKKRETVIKQCKKVISVMPII